MKTFLANTVVSNQLNLSQMFQDPHLPKPSRPTFDSFFLTSRIKQLWNKTKWWWLVVAIVALVVAIIVIALIFAMPDLMFGNEGGEEENDAAAAD